MTANNLFEVSPNPTTGNISLNLPTVIGVTQTIKIYTALGQLVKVAQTNANEIIANLEMDLTTYDKGIYFIQYTAGNEVVVKKVILK